MKNLRKRSIAALSIMIALQALGTVACSSSKKSGDSHSSSSDGQQGDNSGAAPAAGTDAAPAPADGQQAQGTGKWGGAKAALGDVKRDPFQVEGVWMNAYYVTPNAKVTWEGLSQEIYGAADKAEPLKKWNADQKLGTGTVVYYNSPTRHEDSTAMKSFLEEKGVALQEVEVQKGDSLSKIAGKLYGNMKSWREIAMLNPAVADPDRVAPGVKLKVRPGTEAAGDPNAAPAPVAATTGVGAEANHQAAVFQTPPEPPQQAPQTQAPPPQPVQAQTETRAPANDSGAPAHSVEQSGEHSAAAPPPQGEAPGALLGEQTLLEKVMAQLQNPMVLGAIGLVVFALLAALAIKIRGRMQERRMMSAAAIPSVTQEVTNPG